MRGRLRPLVGAVAVAMAFSAGGWRQEIARAGDAEAVPFPVEKTTILRNEKAVYFVEGRRRIPKGVDLTVLRGVRIVGRGKDATLEVEGNFSAHGVFDREVVFENVTLVPMPVFGNIRIDQTIFSGGGVVCPESAPCSGYFMLELMDFVNGAKLDLTVAAGSAELSSVCADAPVRIRAVDTAGDKGNTVKVEIRGCIQDSRFKCQPHGGRVGLVGGLDLQGANEMIVRLSRLGGALTAVRDWRKGLIFDGNKVDSKRLELTQPAAGRFSKAQLFKCDVYSSEVVFSAPPANAKEVEDTPIERFWFLKAPTDKAAAEALIQDGADAPETNGVRVKVGKLNERPLQLAGPGGGK